MGLTVRQKQLGQARQKPALLKILA